MTARYIIGDVFDALESLPDNSVDLVFSSPPFLALRSYLPADHPLKDKEIGSEATPADFLDTLLDVVEACDRVLAPHGSLCFELGDTFAGSGGAGGDYAEARPCPACDGAKRLQGGVPCSPSSCTGGDCVECPTCSGAGVLAGGLRAGQPKFKQSGWSGWDKQDRNNPHAYRKDDETADLPRAPRGGGYGWPLPKSLSGIPTLFAWSLAYGRNLLRPERTTPRWRIRNVVVWARPNPPVGALGDKFRPATSYLTVACKSDKRWFDLDAVREARPGAVSAGGGMTDHADDATKGRAQGAGIRPQHGQVVNAAGAPPLDYWEIPTQPYPGSHYATFPDKLVVKPVKAMCPSKVCRVCGEPSQRITEASYEAHGARVEEAKSTRWVGIGNPDNHLHAQAMEHGRATKYVETLGWTDCGCECPRGCGQTTCVHRWRAGVVLDPFAGSGTTLSVATGHGRDAIGIDIDARNAELALERVGPLFLTVETLADTRPFDPPAEDVVTDAV